MRNTTSLSDGALTVLLRSGYTLAQIAEMFGTHKGTVSRRAKRINEKPSRSKRTSERRQVVETVIDDHGYGVALDRLASLSDLPRATAYRYRCDIRREMIRSAPPPSQTVRDIARMLGGS